MIINRSQISKRLVAGFTLEEVVTAMALCALCFVGTVRGYGLAADRAELSACSLAAQSLAFQRMEQVKAAKWDTMAYPVVDELGAANFPSVTDTLDMPLTGTNAVNATVYTTITSMASDLRTIQIDCVWTSRTRGAYTNTIVCYRSPSQ